MAFNSNGQIQFLVLDSLSHGSKYGLEIIEFISQRTGGNYIMKKPTLYSCLTRMEKKGLVSSSYWGESEFGGKRHYYTITNDGKKVLEQLAPEFEDMQFNTEKETSEETISTSNVSDNAVLSEYKSTDQESMKEDKPIFLQQDSIFNMVKSEENKNSQTISTQQTNEDDEVVENQMDFFSYQPEQTETVDNETETFSFGNSVENIDAQTDSNSTEELNENTQDQDYEKIQYYQNILETNSYPQQPETEEIKDDAKLLDEDEKLTLTPFQEEQNRRLYDTSSELKKYRKKKSFSENQIEMSVVYENAEDREIQKARIEQLKQSMLNARQNGFDNIQQPATFEKSQTNKNSSQTGIDSGFSYRKEEISEDVVSGEEERKDDAIFITNPRIDESQIPIQKKITPPNIEVNIYDDNLPAPKRDSNLEPTYKDMMAKLFERQKEKKQVEYIPQTEESQNYSDMESFADYGTLKKYYAGHGIDFKEYNKTSVERNHNTNLLKFISSAILLLLAGVGCGVLYGILSAVGLTKAETNFMYYTLPILFLVYFIYTLIVYKVSISKKAVLIYNSIINWAVFVLASIVVLVINIICGMQYETMGEFLTTLLVPILGLLITFPVNYYIKKFIYKKFAK